MRETHTEGEMKASLPTRHLPCTTPQKYVRSDGPYLTQTAFWSFCRSQLSHKSVNLAFTITNTKKKLTNLLGNGLLQNDFKDQLTVADVLIVLAVGGNMMRRIEVLITPKVFFAKVNSPTNPSTYPTL